MQRTVRFRVRDGAWERMSSEMGWSSYHAASLDLGVSDTTVYRAIKEGGSPGERLMAALMDRLPRHWRHEDVFELVAEEVRR